MGAPILREFDDSRVRFADTNRSRNAVVHNPPDNTWAAFDAIFAYRPFFVYSVVLEVEP